MSLIKRIILATAFCTPFLCTAQQIKDGVRDAIKEQPYMKGVDSTVCQNAESTAEERRCANYRFQQADSLMQVSFNQLKLKYQPNTKQVTKLIKAQQNWIAQRNKKCHEASDDYKGGSVEMVVFMSCLAEETNKRHKQLMRMLQ